jgi:hypothetical protein
VKLRVAFKVCATRSFRQYRSSTWWAAYRRVRRHEARSKARHK